MQDSHPVSNNQPLTDAQRDELIARMKVAWATLPADKRASLKPLLEQGHQQLADFVKNQKPPQHRFHNILRMKSLLTDDWDGHLQKLDQPAAAPAPAPTVAPVAAPAIEIKVGPEGEILGTGKYQQLDPCWELVAGTLWLENLLVEKHPFPKGRPAIVQIPDQVRIALAGDYGTGNFGADDSPSTKISKEMAKLKPYPDFTIHLGDVYYAGTSEEEKNYLMKYWPKGGLASFTLNSNHEMYSGGGPYFNDAVGGPVFNKFQSPFSFFALENSNWIVVGLDSAYNAGELSLYMDGSLGNNNEQIPFLKDLTQKRKKVIVLTHHNGLQLSGVQSNPPLKLFTEVMGAFQGGAPPAYWYWGHVHAGAVYKPMADQGNMRCRCVGHGALPWGLASELQNSALVEWFEQCNAGDPDNNLRVFNGFVVVDLDGPNLAETFYDELGRVAWTPQGGDPRNCKKA